MNFIETIMSIDFSILDFIQNTIRCDFLDAVMKFLSIIGEFGWIWIFAAIIMLCFRKTRAMGVMVLCALLLGFLVGEVGLKNLVCRPRPFLINTDIILSVKPPSSYSFPSGHSCSSFAAATVMFFRDKKFGIPALVLAILIAFSRLYNYVHFPSDVLCGIILGILSAITVLVIFKKTGFDKKLSGDLKYKKIDDTITEKEK